MEIQAESLFHGLRPDILAVSLGADPRPQYAIEVVVTHDLEPVARQVYAEQNLPVVIVRPTQRGLAQLSRGLVGLSITVLNVECHARQHPKELGRSHECLRCGQPMHSIKVMVWHNYPCRRCGGWMPVLRIVQMDADFKPLNKNWWSNRLIQQMRRGWG